MSVIPVIRCRHLRQSLAFYTNVLDFQCIEHAGDADPSFSTLMRCGSLLLLSSHGGDGAYGQVVVVVTDNVDVVCRRFRERGLKTPGDPYAPVEVHEGPIDQSWGTREFYVNDPDGNTVRFVEGFGIDPALAPAS